MQIGFQLVAEQNAFSAQQVDKRAEKADQPTNAGRFFAAKVGFKIGVNEESIFAFDA